jgi:DNA-binding SARP family transcriptional activator/predicted ATPase
MPRSSSQIDIEERPAIAWRLELLGKPKLLQSGKALEPLERRSALLFAYLALEGPTSRAKLAGLIWSESTDEAARANLRQRLKRLKDALGAELIVPEEVLRLRPDLEVDAVQLESLTFTGEYSEAITFEGELLAGIDSDDSPELEEWLLNTRERLIAARQEALLGESERFETSDLSKALEFALQYQKNDPLSEEAARRVMRLHYLRGDRSSALQAFERFKTSIERELGIAPMSQTLELLRVIERGETTPQHAPKATPMTLQRPPVLVGREHEWAQLEAAWTKGQMILLTGEAGAGKTRLAMDFLTSKGKIAVFEGRPGDALVSYSTNARIHRKLIADYDTLKDMPDWVKLELSRILPELGTPPHPIQNESDKLRFYQAKTEACLLAVRTGISIMLLDDLQFVDNGTFESGIRTWSENVQSGLIKGIIAYREAELNPFVKETLQQALDTGRAVQIKVSSLEAHEVQTMLESLGVEGLAKFGKNMHKATGGNPMFVLETARTLVSNDALEQDNINLPLPESVSAAIRSRLSKLGAPAIRLARVVSVAGTDFDLNLAANVLESHVMDLTESITELESSQVLNGLGFTHDLIAQTTLEGLPLSVRNLLHERIAVYLEKIDANPARIAHHYLNAGQSLKAVPFFEKASLLAVEQYQLRAGIDFATQGAHILEEAGQQEKAFEFWAQIKDVLKDLDQGDELEVVIEALQRTAFTLLQQSSAYHAASEMWVNRGDLVKAKYFAVKANQAAQQANDFNWIGQVEDILGVIYWMQGETSKAIKHHALSIENHRLELQKRIELGLAEVEKNYTKGILAIGLANHAVMLDNLGRYAESEVQHKEAIAVLRDMRDPATLAQALSNLGITLMDQGRGREALEYLIQAKQQEALLSETVLGSVSSDASISDAYMMLNQYSKALEYAHHGLKVAQSLQHIHLPLLYGRLGTLYQIVGAYEQAKNYFEIAQGLPVPNETFANSLSRRYSSFLLEQGQDASTTVEHALSALTKDEHVYRWYIAHLELLSHFVLEKQMQIVNEALKNPKLISMNGLQIFALTRATQIQLEIAKPKKALEYSQKAMVLLEHFDPEAQRAEVLLTHVRALEVNKHKDLKPFLEKTLHWLLETANNHVPPEYCESFLTKNPHNAAILELAKNAGLEVAGFEKLIPA